jgi:hypothetical protein
MLAVFRFLAGTFLLIAVIAAVYDGTRSLGTGGLAMTSLIEHWSRLAPALLNAVQGAVVRATHPLVWEMGLRKLLGVLLRLGRVRLPRPALRLCRTPPPARQRVRQLRRRQRRFASERYRLPVRGRAADDGKRCARRGEDVDGDAGDDQRRHADDQVSHSACGGGS